MFRTQAPPFRNPTKPPARMSEPTQLDRIEAKLDALLEALAYEEEEKEEEDPAGGPTLDGEYEGGERDQNQPL